MFKTINSFWKMIFNASQSENTIIKANRRVYKKNNTPTYVLIARDLESKHKQVFEAAVYYLGVIASLKKDYKDEIIDILNEALKIGRASCRERVFLTV